MEKFLKEISTINWWISVVFVGILINLISKYLPIWIGKYIKSYNQKLLENNEKKKEKKENEIKYIVENPNLITYYLNYLILKFNGIIILFILSSLCLTLGFEFRSNLGKGSESITATIEIFQKLQNIDNVQFSWDKLIDVISFSDISSFLFLITGLVTLFSAKRLFDEIILDLNIIKEAKIKIFGVPGEVERNKKTKN